MIDNNFGYHDALEAAEETYERMVIRGKPEEEIGEHLSEYLERYAVNQGLTEERADSVVSTEGIRDFDDFKAELNNLRRLLEDD